MGNKKDDRRRGLLMATAGSTPESERLPSGYRLLSSIAATGTQYINTGAAMGNYTRIIGYVASPASGQTYTRFWNMEGSPTGSKVQMARHGDNYITGWFGGNGTPIYAPNTNTKLGVNFDLRIQYNGTKVAFSIKYWNGSAWVDGGSTTFTNCVKTSVYAFLFSSNGVSTGTYKYSWRCARYQTGSSPSSLVRDLVACDKGASGAIGMYDLINKTFYSNAGSGTFTRGGWTMTSYAKNLLIYDI